MAINCLTEFCMPSGEPSIKMTLPLPTSAKFLMDSVHMLNMIMEASRLTCCISLAALLIPLATSSRNKATPCPLNWAASRSALAEILMAFPSASAALVLVIRSACPSFSAAAFRLLEATTRDMEVMMASSKVMSLSCKSIR